MSSGGRTTEPPVTPPPPTAPSTEYRAIWVDAFHQGIKTPAQVDKLVADAQKGHINAIFAQVRKRGDSYYNVSLEPRATDSDMAGLPYDPLVYLITKAHAANPRIEVHAWTNTFFVGTGSAVYLQHGSDWGNRTSAGTTGGYLDPSIPEVREYTKQVLLNLVNSYDIDGLHFDFIRHPGRDWGYSSAALSLFNLQTGRTGVPASTDVQWSQWRRDQISGFVRDFYNSVAASKPTVKLSAAMIAWGPGPLSDADWQSTSAYTDVLQDWYGWLGEGTVDLGLVMNYDADWNVNQKNWFDQWIEWEKDHQGKRKLLVGVGSFLNYPEDTFSQIQRVRKASTKGNNVAGVALYSYASTNVYSDDDYWTVDAAKYLPRQPYTSTFDWAVLDQRRWQMNDWFYDALTISTSYTDPAWNSKVTTTPPFSNVAAVPDLPWKAK